MTLQELNKKKKHLLNHQKNLRANLGAVLWRNWIHLPERIKKEAELIAFEYQKAVYEDYPAIQKQIISLMKEIREKQNNG